MDRLHLRVVSVIPEIEAAATFSLYPAEQPLAYEAGQFITLVFAGRQGELRRSYSLSSAPGIDKYLNLTVKRTVNGEISRWLLDKVQPGDSLLSLPPMGRFTLVADPPSPRQIYFLAAGSGIVPIFSLLKTVMADEPGATSVLIYQNHNERTILFAGPLHNLAQSYPGHLRTFHLLSEPIDPLHSPRRLNNQLLEEIIAATRRNDQPVSFFLCGPGAWMRMAAFTLRLLGYTEDQIRKENFAVDAPLPPPALHGLSSERREIFLEYQGRSFRFHAAYPTNLLQAALDHGIELPYSCRSGRCSSCAARRLTGEVFMTNNEVLTEKDLKEGWVLTCVGYALSNLRLTC
jgi:ring-1,2-phenylacetyl-CoA epoxidase subunit PaaE